eukprot:13317468-Alexandrium_andersonii.AAC.1
MRCADDAAIPSRYDAPRPSAIGWPQARRRRQRPAHLRLRLAAGARWPCNLRAINTTKVEGTAKATLAKALPCKSSSANPRIVS